MNYEIGQRVWWTRHDGRQFYMEIRSKHPHADLSDYYSLQAVFADNCLDVPDSWVSASSLQLGDTSPKVQRSCPKCGEPTFGAPEPSSKRYYFGCIACPWGEYLNERDVIAQPVAPSAVDVSVIKEYGLTQKLSNQIRVF